MYDNGLIYIISNDINNKVYIGKTIQTLEKRKWNHFSKWSNCKKLKEAIQNLGKEHFKIDIVECNIPYAILDSKERYYISLYNSVKTGYNIKEGNKNFRGRKKHFISNIIKEQVIKEYKNGISVDLIAEHFKLSITSIYNILSEKNISKNYNKGGFNSKSKIDINDLIKLKKLGYKTTYISNYFNVSKSSVKRFVNRHKDIIFPRVSDILTSNVEDENVL